MTVFSDPSAARVAAAVAWNDAAEVRRLIAYGSDANATGTDGISLLQWALANLSKDAFTALLDNGATTRHTDQDGRSVLHYAAMAEDIWYLHALLTNDVDVDLVNPLTGNTPLMDAVLHGRREQRQLLLAAGADADIADNIGDTPLHLAGEIDDYDSIFDLLRAGADPTRKNRQQATFQRYLAMTPSRLLAADARRDREQLRTWLRDHGLPVDEDL
ncbi:ankyrin repeat domain-containing protein [Nocardia sp. NPDC006044]|uniref:ankyrin repeat domain-containing protein n=1 Tax=Nocardia sp. NPDC006044 TaxID=3364306 RepID=UPI003683BCF0